MDREKLENSAWTTLHYMLDDKSHTRVSSDTS